MAEPLIILALARSGSSAVVSMLGQHPQLASVPELRLFHKHSIAELLTDELPGYRDDPRLAGLLRTLATVHEGTETGPSVSRARSWLHERRHWPCVDLFEYIRQHFLPRAIVEKSPETVRTGTALWRALSNYPNARFIHLVRHPWASVASMVDAWRPLPWWGVEVPKMHRFCARHWLDQHRLITTSLKEAGVNWTRVRAEDLTGVHALAIQSLCRWAQISCGEKEIEAMRRPELSTFARPGPPGAEGGLDKKFLESPRLKPVISPNTLFVPRHWNIDDEISAAVCTFAAELGYHGTEA